MDSLEVVEVNQLILSMPQTSTYACANSVDPDEPSPLDIHCLPFCFSGYTEAPIFNNGHIQIQRWKRPLQELGGEWDNITLVFMRRCELLSTRHNRIRQSG